MVTERIEDPDPLTGRRLVRYTLAIALALGTIETAKALVVSQARGLDFGPGRALLTNMSWWLLWVPLAWAVFRLARRVQPRAGRMRWALTHTLACVVLSLVHLGASAVLVRAGAMPPPGFTNTVAVQFRQLVTGYLLTDFVTYGVVLASYMALMAAQRARSAEEEKARLTVAALHAEADRARLEALMMSARLRALRSELDPHFLFNSLHSVTALVQRGDTDAAIRMISRIGELLRVTLEGREDAELTLGEEIGLLGLYLDIEMVRFADRLTTRLLVPADLRRALVPSLVLQPLVENAIRHGVARSSGPVSIQVEAEAVGDALCLSVRDTGPGPGEGSPRGTSGAGVGLRNVRERLEALYGDDAGVTLRAPPDGGAEARVTLPLRLPEPMEFVT